MEFLPLTRRLSREVLDILFPISCVGCGAYATGNREQRTGNKDDADAWFCAACRERIEPEVPRCLVCKEHSPTGRTCYACLPNTPLAGTVAVGRYSDPLLRSAIFALKFRNVRALAKPLGELLARRIAATILGHGEWGTHPLVPPPAGLAGTRGKGHGALIPLPLHPRRERKRGFNQARELAEVVGALLELPVRDLLVRTRPTESQTSLWGSPATRRENVADAFALRPPVSGSRLPDTERAILIDDVLTSGATLEAAASVLRAAGAKEIWAAVVARG